MFFMLTLYAYAVYAARPFSWGRYLAVVVLFALGLMAKPMLVTLPGVLLLLDYWPLGGGWAIYLRVPWRTAHGRVGATLLIRSKSAGGGKGRRHPSAIRPGVGDCLL